MVRGGKTKMVSKKNLAVFFIVAAIIGSGAAWTVGTTLTPQEFASVDLDAHNFAPTPRGNEIVGSTETSLFKADVQINTFEKSGAGYEEKNRVISSYVSISDYVNCRDTGETITACKGNLKEKAVSTIASNILAEKSVLKQEQEAARKFALYASELRAGDIAITQAEIEAGIASKTK